MISGELDLREGTISALIDADKLLKGDETLGKKKKDGEGAVTLEVENGNIIFTYIREGVGKTVVEYTIEQELEGHVLVEISWSVKRKRINLFVDNELVKQEEMNVEGNLDLDESQGFSFFHNGIL